MVSLQYKIQLSQLVFYQNVSVLLRCLIWCVCFGVVCFMSRQMHRCSVSCSGGRIRLRQTCVEGVINRYSESYIPSSADGKREADGRRRQEAIFQVIIGFHTVRLRVIGGRLTEGGSRKQSPEYLQLCHNSCEHEPLLPHQPQLVSPLTSILDVKVIYVN